jgi:hypothetical protein
MYSDYHDFEDWIEYSDADTFTTMPLWKFHISARQIVSTMYDNRGCHGGMTVDHIMVCLPWLDRDGVLLITDTLEDQGFIYGHKWGFALTEESPHLQDDWLA